MILNTDRYSSTSTLRKNGVVVHDSEGSEGTLPWGQTASAQLAAMLAGLGDRPSPSRPGGVYGSGYHAIAQEDGTPLILAGADAAPYHAPPCNPTMWSICIPGKAAQTRDQWLDGPSRQYIRAVARYIVDRWNDDARSWPLEFRTAGQLVATKANTAGHPSGYTSHAQVSQAWHQTDHTDPGPSFPFDVLADDIAALTAVERPAVETAPPAATPTTSPAHLEDNDMANIGIICPADAAAQFIGVYVGPPDGPRFLELSWIRDNATIALRDAHIAAGATQFGGTNPTPGAARIVKAHLRNCFVDVLPHGDWQTDWASPRDIVARG